MRAMFRRGRVSVARLSVLAVAGLLATAPNAMAQDRAALVEAFSGQWYVFDPGARSGTQPCEFNLQDSETTRDADLLDTVHMRVNTNNCTAPFDGVNSWSIEGAHLVFYTHDGVRLAELGGNQQRISGETVDGGGIIVERLSGDGGTLVLSEALQRHRCLFKAYTAECATSDQLQVPSPQDAPDNLAQIQVLVALAVRRQPRRDSSMIGTVPEGACLSVNQCLVASDGVWCRARFGESEGWMARNAVRQQEWPVVTFVPECPAND